MRNLLNQIIEEVVYRASWRIFSNETIIKNLSNSRFYKCEFKNIVFDTVYFVNLSSLECRISNCQILGSDLTRVEFGNTSFTSCEFKQVDLSGSLFTNAQFRNKIWRNSLIGLILSDLKIKTTTFHDLEFSKTYPVRIHKLKKVRELAIRIVFKKF
jgi:uncharacterized protein YjbI with pentapeptide repeats